MIWNCLGLQEAAWDSLLELMIAGSAATAMLKKETDEAVVIDPCTPQGYKWSLEERQHHAVSVSTATHSPVSSIVSQGNFSECRSAAYSLLQKDQGTKWPWPLSVHWESSVTLILTEGTNWDFFLWLIFLSWKLCHVLDSFLWCLGEQMIALTQNVQWELLLFRNYEGTSLQLRTVSIHLRWSFNSVLLLLSWLSQTGCC
jgi:hypothetical protein